MHHDAHAAGIEEVGPTPLKNTKTKQGARCHVGAPPPREKEQRAYTFSQTLRSLIRGLNIVKVELARPFERVVALDLSTRLDEPPSYRMFVEIMASRSNVVLVAIGDGGVETVAACAYQVGLELGVVGLLRRNRITQHLYHTSMFLETQRLSYNKPLNSTGRCT